MSVVGFLYPPSDSKYYTESDARQGSQKGGLVLIISQGLY